ncbi:hypothetical protein BD779DRAFT_73816 [Infundibulicybe gibba]|nr:hypothetical protein BD779DRAFT_73816 [Infundibulicybe gibba]
MHDPGLIYHVRHSIYNISPHSSLHAYTTVLWHLTVFILTTMTHLTSAVSARHPLQSPWIRTPSRRNHALVRLEILLIDLILICNVSVPTACDWLQKCPRITRLVVDPQELCHELRHVELRFDAKKHMFLQVLGTLNQHCEDPRVGEELKGSYVFEQFRTTRCYGGSPTWLLRRRDTYVSCATSPRLFLKVEKEACNPLHTALGLT